MYIFHHIGRTPGLRRSPREILTGLNRSLWGQLEHRMYVTACVGMLDVSESSLEVSNAGHPPVYRFSGRMGSVEELGTSGLPLGMRPDVEYKEKKAKVEPGDVLVFYTDGTYEARDSEGMLYGFERLEQLIGSLDSEMSAREWIDRILEDVEQFADVSQHEDDMSLVVVRVI